MTQVKICGVCHPADAAMAAAAGADYIGVILAPGFGRTRTLEEARAIFSAAGNALRVGVFVDATSQDIAHAARELRLDAAQLHGDEPRALLRELRGAAFALWKAVRVRAAEDVTGAVSVYGDVVDALLLDGWSADTHGGAGVRFDLDAVARLRSQVPATLRLIAAGGLDATNAGDVVRRLRPDVVDVSSGVEEAHCRKSAERVQEFIAAVRGAEVVSE